MKKGTAEFDHILETNVEHNGTFFYNSKHETYFLKHIYELKDKSSMFLKSIQRSFKYSQSLS